MIAGAKEKIGISHFQNTELMKGKTMVSAQYVYSMHRLGKTYPGGKEVLKDISLSFLPGAKIGVLGLNGAGKSTLLKIMAGIEKEFTGEAKAAEGLNIGYLAQEPELDTTLDVAGNVLSGLGARTCKKKVVLLAVHRHL